MKNAEDLRHEYSLGKDTRDWSVQGAKNDIETLDGVVTQIAYRPFDTRWTYYTGRSKGFHCMPRGNVMKHLCASSPSPIEKNIGLVFARGDSTPYKFSMIFVSDTLIDNLITAAQTAGIAYVAPFYLHNDKEMGEEWTPSFNNEVLARLTQNLADKLTPIEIFDYVYGILHDPVYREKYNEFLKRDFPRVPIIENEEVFRKYVNAGKRLRKLHLMQTKVPAALTLEPNTAEDLEIGAVKYKDGVLHLNKNKQIHGIPENVWAYRIGGYQVIDKWLKSHKGKTMTIDDFDHIANIVGLLGETIKIQDELRLLSNSRGVNGRG